MKNSQNPVVSVVLGTYNRKKFLKKTIQSVREELKNAQFKSEIIIIDGGSTDGTIRWLAKQKDILTIIQHNRGKWRGKDVKRRSWGYFMNLGFKCAQGKYICMISDDCLIIPGAIINGYNLFEEELAKGNNVGAVAFYWRNWPEDTNFYVKCTIKDKMMVNHGIFLSQVLKEIDYIEENLYIFYCADGDLSLKIWNNGYNIIASKKSLIEHYSHANTGVRKQNSSFYKSDLAAKINRWNGVFYPNGTNLTGNDLELDYPYISDIGRNNFFWTYILHDKAQMILYKILDLIKDGCRIIAFKYLK